MSRADEDGDGKVTEAEMTAYRESGDFRPPSSQETVDALDSDGDGLISNDELPERMAGFYMSADKNEDGKISVEELEVRREEMEARRAEWAERRNNGEGGTGGPGAGRFQGFGNRPGGGRPGGPGDGGRDGGPGGRPPVERSGGGEDTGPDGFPPL